MDERRPDALFGLGNAALIEKLIVLLLFLAFLSGLMLVLLPFGVGLMFGGVIAVAAWPLRQALRSIGMSPGWAATVLLGALLAFVAVPILLLAPRLAGETARILDVVRVWLETAPPPPQWLESIPIVGDSLKEQWIEAFTTGAKPHEILAPYAEPLRGALLICWHGCSPHARG